ncbi:GFA family protein [uncultured Parasphingopyxis sp.]|uniref:GFA family protein n=1 Tax=uncultured Parasphingopyxis sp. TaxID=1547918 RepID=UPI00262F9B67|nr:GFA family protein [uncultured Parasphingopyxis sp.]
MGETMEGGCQCRRIRYRANIDDVEAYLCHCRMCQRATGGVSIAFKNLKKTDVIWETEPDWYDSSPIAHRPFCAHCGTPLGFAFPDSENMDLTIGSFDDPSRFVPRHHFGAEALQEAWLDTRDLPRYRADEHEPTVRRWKEKVGKLPD